MLNATNIPSARVPLIDERTGLVSREWFSFFQNLFYLTGGGGNDTTLTEVQYPPAPDVAETLSSMPVTTDEVSPSPLGVAPFLDPSIGLSVETLTSLTTAIEAISIAPQSSSEGLLSVTTDTTLTGAGTTVSPLGLALKAPVTVTADYTVLPTDQWLINTKPSAACTLTLPAASGSAGRQITVKNLQSFAVNSASSSVVPIDSTTAGTFILLPVIGNWAKLVSDGTNWIIMQQAPNNVLLLE